MPVDRLSALDECFLRVESDAAPMQVGWTLVLDGEPPTVEELRRRIAGRLDRLPRFRRRVLISAAHLHDPVWVDDPRFDLTAHVLAERLSAPGGAAELRELAGRLLSQRLDRARPLWRVYVVEGLHGGLFALVGQAHHALVDGLAALQMAQLLLDPVEAADRSDPQPWDPSPVPNIGERVLASGLERARLASRLGLTVFRAMGAPGEVAAELRRAGTALAAIGAPAPRTAVNGRIGAERSVAFARLPLPAVRQVGERRGATIGDVGLAVSALALGRHLRRAGESHPWLRAMVPVSTRSEPDGEQLGNQLSVMFVELPVGERDPCAALEEVRYQTQAHKEARIAGTLDGLVRAAAIVPGPLRDAAAWGLTRPQTFNTVVSNIPGPSEPLYLLGRQVRAAYPAVPLARGHGLSVGMLSYCGVLHVGLFAHPGVVADVAELARDFGRAFDALRAEAGPWAPSGPGLRRRARRRSASPVLA